MTETAKYMREINDQHKVVIKSLNNAARNLKKANEEAKKLKTMIKKFPADEAWLYSEKLSRIDEFINNKFAL